MMNEVFEATKIIMEANDSQLLKFLATQKFYDIAKSTGRKDIALEVLKASVDLEDTNIKGDNDERNLGN